MIVTLIKLTENDKRLIIVLLLLLILLFVIVGYIGLLVRKIMSFQASKADDMLHDVVKGRRDDDASGLLIIQGDALLVLECGRHPVVQGHVELLLRLTRRLYHLLVGQALVLVERQPRSDVPGGIHPLVAVFLFGVFLQIGSLHHLPHCLQAAEQCRTEQHEKSNALHNRIVYYRFALQRYEILLNKVHTCAGMLENFTFLFLHCPYFQLFFVTLTDVELTLVWKRNTKKILFFFCVSLTYS